MLPGQRERAHQEGEVDLRLKGEDRESQEHSQSQPCRLDNNGPLSPHTHGGIRGWNGGNEAKVKADKAGIKKTLTIAFKSRDEPQNEPSFSNTTVELVVPRIKLLLFSRTNRGTWKGRINRSINPNIHHQSSLSLVHKSILVENTHLARRYIASRPIIRNLPVHVSIEDCPRLLRSERDKKPFRCIPDESQYRLLLFEC